MYSWGRSTKDWQGKTGYDYRSARGSYMDNMQARSAASGKRTYLTRNSPDSGLVGTRGKTIESGSKNPIVVAIDVTGSMSTWPKEIFDRVPLFDQTLSQYRPDMEICYAAIGDANCDNYPLQVNDFARGVDLEKKLNALCPEGGGGGQLHESYELFGYYMLNHCNVDKSVAPLLFIYGDEGFYEKIMPAQVKHYVGDDIVSPLDSYEMWSGLMEKFELYLLHKAYGSGNDAAIDKKVTSQWARAIGKEKIIELPNKERAVDIALGIIAKHWGEYGDFTTNIAARQDSANQASVHNSLRFIPDAGITNSIVTGRTKGNKTIPLGD